ncbi:hypothetical protein crov507 [Cafeteria roenbergensis virus]|uniref:FNIP repeat-containing protein n=1 Tax=Cafeteria roenbergensis virus (strain BV-PW1) TaxID=693272 RepID=E3T5S8_CROVB|nr:hypothetical protein crov507 [Cafeteria roenbergensis virus BV-PW1]ADO67541.1 hypothetical protein crov507 [Cafeteria roenbergensis virus BV-PW1]
MQQKNIKEYIQVPSFNKNSLYNLYFGRNDSVDLSNIPNYITHIYIDYDNFFILSSTSCPSLTHVRWPSHLESIEFPIHFNQPIEHIIFPDSLKRMVLTQGDSFFNYPIYRFKWPKSLIELTFYQRNHSLKGIQLPNLKYLNICGEYNLKLPDSIETLYLQRFVPLPSHEVSKELLLPKSLTKLVFGSGFDDSLEIIKKWPDSLTTLTFGYNFNQAIEKVKWPKSLTTLTFGYNFNQAIEKVKWPESLTTLTFGYNFNQAIEKVKWPKSLTTLTFGYNFNQAIEKVKWPKSLTTLTFGYNFNQAIEKVKWPESLTTLTFDDTFNQPIENVCWSKSLTTLTFGENFKQTIEFLPENLEKLKLKLKLKIVDMSYMYVTPNLPNSLKLIEVYMADYIQPFINNMTNILKEHFTVETHPFIKNWFYFIRKYQ